MKGLGGDVTAALVGFYGGRALLWGGFLLMGVLLMHPWILLLVGGGWWLYARSRHPAQEATTPPGPLEHGVGRPIQHAESSEGSTSE